MAKELKTMIDFLFRKDLWILDLAAASFFAYRMGAAIQRFADSGQEYPDEVMLAACIAAFTYLVGFVLALKLKGRYPSLSSWTLIGLSGALLHITLRWIGNLPDTIDYQLRYSESISTSIAGFIKDTLAIIGINFLIWAILGCIFILAARFLAYFLLALWRLIGFGLRGLKGI